MEISLVYEMGKKLGNWKRVIYIMAGSNSTFCVEFCLQCFMLFNTHVCQIFLFDASFSFRRREDLRWPHWFIILLWSNTRIHGHLETAKKTPWNDSPRWNAWKSTCNTWDWIKSRSGKERRGICGPSWRKECRIYFVAIAEIWTT